MAKWAQLPAMMALACGSAAMARPASEIERYYLGHYVVKTEDSARTLCRVEIAWADDVGGQFAAKGCGSVPAIAESARWVFDADTGEARFEDPLHRPRFRLAETDAGFIAILPDESRYWFETPPAPARAPARRKR
ncbi:hypothetical protein [Sphingomonas colocasiae]|uniref:Alkaline proteinase inhibitor/ Outer membrane lipoprotein Omp19 domain-containing protein n=1 Tax=Sphingomonas colocasiae TaxID=1848973 RepID=A0ABS7PUJ6_9SPHN|nr:hypothetical protein [Sphingomonas colocasiae]MBY8825026.1 hypothetical protein [Sphingomonas colocasiae]